MGNKYIVVLKSRYIAVLLQSLECATTFKRELVRCSDKLKKLISGFDSVTMACVHVLWAELDSRCKNNEKVLYRIRSI
jgi:hypothetical protein